MMKVKVIPYNLDGDFYTERVLEEYCKYSTPTTVIYYRQGQYYDRATKTAWVEFTYKDVWYAFLIKATQFNYDLSLLQLRPLRDCEVQGLLSVKHLLTRELKSLLSLNQQYRYLIQLSRNTRLRLKELY